MRRAARTDANQAELVVLARKLGLRVFCRNDDLADLDVQYGGQHEVWEIKDGAKSASRRKLTPRQEAIRREGWCIRLVTCAEDVLSAARTLRLESLKIDSILITGGTGSFGKAFCRYALGSGVKRVCIYSRDEHKQANMREEFGNDPRLRWFIGDVRDRDRLQWAMQGCYVVVHAAALKRIEVGYYNPEEMVKTNVGGASNVIAAARDAGVPRVVALSTDKAWRPVSPYGASKALVESLFLAANNTRSIHGTRFAVTRYGNVAGTAGSVIPRWRHLVATGALEVPVTDPDCTRFWMRMDEAVELVAAAIELMPGDVLIPENLPAYRLGDLAEAMGVGVRVIGLPAWEKKHEGMRDGLTSDAVRRMSVEELREALKHV